MPLTSYTIDEDDKQQREEKMNAQFLGTEVWIKATVLEVATEFPGGILVSVESYDSEGEDTTTEFTMSCESDDLMVVDPDTKLLVDG